MKAKKKRLPRMREFSCLWYFCGQSKTEKIGVLKMHEKVVKRKEKNLISFEIRFFLVETTGLEPVTSCV